MADPVRDRPGDYVRKSLGLQDVIMTRGADGQVRLLLNRCAHRGNLVCEAERGHAKSFRCPYHRWTYKNTGELPVVDSEFADRWRDA
jgi:phenylpropionate dioxygenase-like ring-hydroxylating dioxygenase large terminal subunit